MIDPTGNGSADRFLASGAPGIRRWAPDEAGEPVAPLDFREVLRICRRRAVLILAITGVCTAGAAYWAHSQAMLYDAKAVVRLRDARRAITGGLSEGSSDALVSTSIDPLLSQIEVLQSRAVAGEVVDSLPELRVRASGFDPATLHWLSVTTPESRDSVDIKFGRSGLTVESGHRSLWVEYGEMVNLAGVSFRVDAPPQEESGHVTVLSREDAIVRLLKSLSVKPREATDVVDVTYVDTDPRIAQRTANQIVQVFQRASSETAQRQSVRRRKFLEEQLKSQDSVLTAARVGLSGFRGRERAFSARAKFETEQEEMKGLSVRRQELGAQRQIIQKLLDGFSSANTQAEGLGALLASPDIANNPTIQQLYSQLVKYQSARDSLTIGRWSKGPNNPDVLRFDDLIASTQTQLLGAFRGLLSSIDARIASLDQLKASSDVTFPSLSATEERESGLQEQVESAQRTVEQLRIEYERARLAEAVEVGEVELVDLAALPTEADGLKPVLRIAFGLLLGLGLGLAVACVLEYLNTSIRRRNQVRSTLGLSELAVIPQLKLPGGTRTRLTRSLGKGSPNGSRQNGRLDVSRLVTSSDTHSIGAEAYRVLRTSLLFSHASESLRTILVTSPTPGDGKTTVASNLAVTFAQQGIRTLLVDCDLRRGHLNTAFHVSRDPGLSDLLTGRTDLESAIRITSVPDLSLLTTGTIPRAPAELLGSPMMRELLRTLVQKYEMVVSTPPPCSPPRMPRLWPLSPTAR